MCDEDELEYAEYLLPLEERVGAVGPVRPPREPVGDPLRPRAIPPAPVEA